MNNFVATIGLEIHVVVNSKLKMFSKSKSCHTDNPNTNINFVDLAFPGMLPQINSAVVKKGICLAKLLNMKVASILSFDRKNYFYRDLPKGFQITQKQNPIGTNGYIKINTKNGTKNIRIDDIHIEEDTAKQTIDNGNIWLDYNRCGMPLIEIVSKPDFCTSDEIVQYLTELRRILIFSNISDAKLEEGSLRVDVNISVRPIGQSTFGTRTEIKNINSISNIEKAINYEIKRQESLLLQGIPVEQDTLKWDENVNKTVFMRKKDTEFEYYYFNEPNILPIQISNNLLHEALNETKLTYFKALDILKNTNYDKKIIATLLDDYDLFMVFYTIINKINDQALVLTWIINELVGIVKKNNNKISDIGNHKINEIINMLELLKLGKINSKQAKRIISEIYLNNKTTNQIIEQYNFKQITDEKILLPIINEIISANQEMVMQYLQRPERVEKFILGKIMQKTNAQANPVEAMKIVKRILTK